MKLIVYRPMLYGLLCWLDVTTVTAGTTMTVIPSNNVEVNQSVTLQCDFDPTALPPMPVEFSVGPTTLCILEANNGVCKNTPDECLTRYSASCPSNTRYSIQVTVLKEWNGKYVVCSSLYGTNSSIISVKVPVTSVMLTPISTTVSVGEQIKTTCTTSYSNPVAGITWYKSSLNITSQSTSTENTSTDGLVRTVSMLQIIAVKEDNGKDVYCRASNTPDKSVTSNMQTLNVMYKPAVEYSTPNPYKVRERQTAILSCTVTEANPNTSIIWRWIKTDSPNTVLHNGTTYTISNITRQRSGSYSCTASNRVGTSEAATIVVDVQYKPEVKSSTPSPYRVLERQTATLTCTLIDANPNTGITWRWIKTDSPYVVLHNGTTYTISSITRQRSGSYSCTASNSVGTSEAATVEVDVQYKPEVKSSTPSPYRVKEGQTAILTCTMIDANPNTGIAWRWFKTDSPSSLLHSNSTYAIPNIMRGSSGSYTCTASNTIGTSEAATIEVDVQYKPSIVPKSVMIVNETARVVLTREILSNPLSNVSWYNGTQLLKSEIAVNTTQLIIDKAVCADTKNFTLVASNDLQWTASSLVELIVNCKPMSDATNITLGISENTTFAFSTIVIAYPEPGYVLLFENGTKYSKIANSLTVNAVNNFTIHFNKTFFEEVEYGTYHLDINNMFGETTVYVNLLAQRRPDSPQIIQATCNKISATIQWKSSFDGGNSQTFVALAFIDQREVGRSGAVNDTGETKQHEIQLQNLQSSTYYAFYVVAQNKHGNSSSEKIQCKTTEDSEINLPLITGGATAGGISLAAIVICIVVLLRRYRKLDKHVGKSQRLDNDNGGYEDEDGDGMKDNILYVSAGPCLKDEEKPESSVYAAVKKSVPSSNNNTDIYADVKKEKVKAKDEGANYSDAKPKKGLFSKDVRTKQKKGKKLKNKQEAADVYENSEDIAMTNHPENVYSNTEHNAKAKQEERGYKNKDGLLYIEVQFDGKKEKGNEKGNPVIHGEDEKTDYATVEFPMSSSSKEANSVEKM